MIKICSFSLWGHKYEYWNGALLNARIHCELDSGYDIYIFVDKYSLEQASADQRLIQIIRELESLTTLIVLDRIPSYMGMFWRMLPFLWSGVERVIVRDADSILTKRELMAVRLWEDSGLSFHIMRDHPAHTSVVMGGMFGGIVNAQMRNIFLPLKTLLNVDRLNPLSGAWQIDQIFLKRYVFPVVRSSSLVHDPFYERVPFPLSRNESEYVGDAVTRRIGDVQDVALKVIESYLNGVEANEIASDPESMEALYAYKLNLKLFKKGMNLIDSRYLDLFHQSGKIDLLDKNHSLHGDFD